MKGFVPKLNRASPTILTCIGAIGVVATAATAVKATPKAMAMIEQFGYEKGSDENPILDMEYTPLTFPEMVKVAWKAYIPSIAIGAATILCIFGANGLNKRQQAAITSAYALLDQTYKQYRDTVKELYGDDADVRVRKELAKSDLNDIHKPEEGKLLFYDEASSRYFERTMLEVMDAEYHLNREFITEGRVCLNDFYDLLGLPKTKLGATVGWSIDSAVAFFGYQWIDFEHELVELEDGLECYILHMEFAPSPDF